MSKNIEFQEIEVQEVNAPNEKGIVETRYNYLLSEQPELQTIEPQRLTSSMIGGCFASLLPIYLDSKDPFQDVEILGGFIVVFFLIGIISARYIGQFLNDWNNKKALVQNIETLQNWKRPIIILPKNRFDNFVDAKANEIIDILNDNKCFNTLHIALKDAEMSFEYAIEYGFRTGEKAQTNTGLPVVGLIPELFVLRGAFDDKIWFEFQQEAVRIALQIDNEFAKCWFAYESEKYRTIAGGQLPT